MNRETHESYARMLVKILSHIDPKLAKKIFCYPGCIGDFATHMSMPDRAKDLTIKVPGMTIDSVLGHNLTSMQHFLVNGHGYCMNSDPSLSVLDEGTSILASLVGAKVEEVRDPNIPTTLCTVLSETQHKAELTKCLKDIVFPSAWNSYISWGLEAYYNFSHSNMQDFVRHAGYALHFVQDACVPHHAWGALLYGHAEWEESLARLWNNHVVALGQASDANLWWDTLGQKIEQEATGHRTLQEYANQTIVQFGKAKNMPECDELGMLRVSIQALTASLDAFMGMVTR